jgi:uncharacterized membrane protein YfcA
LFLAGLSAGFLDAIAGGGGLISVPALLWAGLPPQMAVTARQGCLAPPFSSIRHGVAAHDLNPEL